MMGSVIILRGGSRLFLLSIYSTPPLSFSYSSLPLFPKRLCSSFAIEKNPLGEWKMVHCDSSRPSSSLMTLTTTIYSEPRRNRINTDRLLLSTSSAYPPTALNQTSEEKWTIDNYNTLSLLMEEDYDPQGVTNDINRAAQWNQDSGNSKNKDDTTSKSKWDPKFAVRAVDLYERHLKYIRHRLRSGTFSSSPKEDMQVQSCDNLDPKTGQLLSSATTERALKALLRCKLPTPSLSKRVREIECLVGRIDRTPLTDDLSLRLLEANGKSGNVGRSMALLQLRRSRGYPPRSVFNTGRRRKTEFDYAIQSLISASLYLRRGRSIFTKDTNQPELDNPTRWLDAILLNMSERGEKLTTAVANKMLRCYAMTGRTGRAVHGFYQVKLDPVDIDGRYYGTRDEFDRILLRRRNIRNEEVEKRRQRMQHQEEAVKKVIPVHIREHMPLYRNRKAKVRLKMRKNPPCHKVPSEVRKCGGKVLREKDGKLIGKLEWEKGLNVSCDFMSLSCFMLCYPFVITAKRLVLAPHRGICLCRIPHFWSLWTRSHRPGCDIVEHAHQGMLFSWSALEGHGSHQRHHA